MKFLLELLAGMFVVGALIITWALCDVSAKADEDDDWKIFK